MPLCVAQAAFGAWVGAAAMYMVLMLAGMPGEAHGVFDLMLVFNGVQLGALLYEKKHGGDSVAD